MQGTCGRLLIGGVLKTLCCCAQECGFPFVVALLQREQLRVSAHSTYVLELRKELATTELELHAILEGTQFARKVIGMELDKFKEINIYLDCNRAI